MADNTYKNSKEVSDNSLRMDRFQDVVMKPYLEGRGENDVPADELAARSLIPPLTAAQRSFANVASEIPVYAPELCISCMECVIQCPDAAVHARVTPQADLDAALAGLSADRKAEIMQNIGRTKKFWDLYEKKGNVPGNFSIWIDPDKCKGCGECAEICKDRGALKMTHKDDALMNRYRANMVFLRDALPKTKPEYISDRLLTDMFLNEDYWNYHGGAGACMGCGEITTLKMVMTATASKYGKNMAIVAATGCNSVYSSSYPYSIFDVPWTNPLFENAPTTALGVRLRLDQTGHSDTKLWAVGGDGAMLDIGFQPLSRVLASGADVNILVLDTQVYSNTGGQTSTASFHGQNAKMSAHGKKIPGKTEQRKELGLIAMMHPDTFVAQVSAHNYNHFLQAVLDAVEFPGPSVVITYSPCMAEHGIGDNMAFTQAEAAVTSRAFPLFVYDPRKGETIKERLSLKGNPSLKEDWHVDKKTGEVQDFVWFAKSEGRFAKQFNRQGEPSDVILKAQAERLTNWKRLKELAGLL